MPRLGFFVGNETRVPYDYHEVLACIAPRPVLVIAPAMDKDAVAGDVRRCADEAKEIYGLYGKAGHLQLSVPNDYNRFSTNMRETAYQWLRERKAEGQH